MNPDKLFDYLDGKLTPADREALEEKLMTDAQLRRQFDIAREIHRSGGARREVIVPDDDDPATVARRGKLGRRIATAAIALVIANVLIGLLVIAGRNNKQKAFSAKETEIRQQLVASLGAAAQNAMPPPTFTADEIKITAPAAQWADVASRVSAAAERCSGSAAKDLPEEGAERMLVDIPARGEAEFRQLLANAGLIPPSGTATSQGAADAVAKDGRTVLRVRIAEAGQ
ncbi:MAG: hypothetical protein M3Y80_09675 [Verrucomicrobiota bacterium]|nr:hypothetical protein [Verrucomicrobiota bacterium]